MTISTFLSAQTTEEVEENSAKSETQTGDLLQDGDPLGTNYRTLAIWPRSALKLIYKDIIIYYILHITITMVYDFVLTKEQQRYLDAVSIFFRSGFPDLNGLAVDAVVMVSGFLFTMSVSRYFNVNFAMPGIQRVLIIYIYGLKSAEEFQGRSKWIKKYSKLILLKWALTFRTLSVPFRRKYPTIASLQSIEIFDSPLLNNYERGILEDCDRHSYQAAGLQVFRWSLTLVRQTMLQRGFLNAGDASKAIDALHLYKKSCGNIIKFVVRNIPLAATQTVICTSYAYAILNLLGRPFNAENRVSSGLYGYFPFWSSAIMFMFFTWMRTALLAANPFGDEEQDIDCIALFDSHIRCVVKHVSYVDNETNLRNFINLAGIEELGKSKRIEAVDHIGLPNCIHL